MGDGAWLRIRTPPLGTISLLKSKCYPDCSIALREGAPFLLKSKRYSVSSIATGSNATLGSTCGRDITVDS